MNALRQVGVRLRSFRLHWPSKKTDEEIGEKVVEGVAVGGAIRVVSAILAASAASAAVAVVTTRTSQHADLQLSKQGAAFITRHEGVRYYPYNDPSGIAACTVGVGHVIGWHRCTPVELATRYTVAQVLALLLRDSSVAAGCINRLAVDLDQAQFDALVDLTFNAGCGSLDYRGVRNSLQHGAFSSVPAEIRITATTAGGIMLAGLVTRRRDEATLFATRFYGPGLGYYLPPKPSGYWCRHYRYAWRTCV